MTEKKIVKGWQTQFIGFLLHEEWQPVKGCFFYEGMHLLSLITSTIHGSVTTPLHYISFKAFNLYSLSRDSIKKLVKITPNI